MLPGGTGDGMNRLIALLACLYLIGVLPAGATVVAVVSHTPDGRGGNGPSHYPRLSANGRFVAFDSLASDPVPGDTNAKDDVFVYDVQTGVVEMVSVSSSGGQGNGWSRAPSISADGRFVAFCSEASNLVPEDGNNCSDIFIRDRVGKTTSLISATAGGGAANHHSTYPSLSTDGNVVAFQSVASDLVPGDTNDLTDVFVLDRAARMLTMVEPTSTVENGFSIFPVLSADGRCVVFATACPLLPEDKNGDYDA